MIHRLIDDATRYYVGIWAYARHENNAGARHILNKRSTVTAPREEAL